MKHIAVFETVNQETGFKGDTRLRHLVDGRTKETYEMVYNDDRCRYEVVRSDGSIERHSPHYELCLWRLFHLACEINKKNEET